MAFFTCLKVNSGPSFIFILLSCQVLVDYHDVDLFFDIRYLVLVESPSNPCGIQRNLRQWRSLARKG